MPPAIRQEVPVSGDDLKRGTGCRGVELLRPARGHQYVVGTPMSAGAKPHGRPSTRYSSTIPVGRLMAAAIQSAKAPPGRACRAATSEGHSDRCVAERITPGARLATVRIAPNTIAATGGASTDIRMKTRSVGFNCAGRRPGRRQRTIPANSPIWGRENRAIHTLNCAKPYASPTGPCLLWGKKCTVTFWLPAALRK